IARAGAWSFSSQPTPNELATRLAFSGTLALSSADGTLTSVTIHIAGTNDAAVLSAAVANLTETNLAADISTAGTLTISDVDSPATFVEIGRASCRDSAFATDSAGAWTYTASSAHNEFAAGSTYIVTSGVRRHTGSPRACTSDVCSTDLAAVLSAAVANLTETNLAADISTAGTLTISDVDSPATFV